MRIATVADQTSGFRQAYRRDTIDLVKQLNPSRKAVVASNGYLIGFEIDRLGCLYLRRRLASELEILIST